MSKSRPQHCEERPGKPNRNKGRTARRPLPDTREWRRELVASRLTQQGRTVSRSQAPQPKAMPPARAAPEEICYPPDRQASVSHVEPSPPQRISAKTASKDVKI